MLRAFFKWFRFVYSALASVHAPRFREETCTGSYLICSVSTPTTYILNVFRESPVSKRHSLPRALYRLPPPLFSWTSLPCASLHSPRLGVWGPQTCRWNRRFGPGRPAVDCSVRDPCCWRLSVAYFAFLLTLFALVNESPARTLWVVITYVCTAGCVCYCRRFI